MYDGKHDDPKWEVLLGKGSKRSRIRETLNLSTDADSSTDIFVSAGVKKGVESIFFLFFLTAVVVVAAVAAKKAF